ncbi:class I SAM-dependent methyltransferase [Ferribacterium limneticum]|uniref:class I SAM-dependent methyltransferase n=1 Tax=Ferribacterium limneticum TaxID=76259 RepID=UPI001CF853AE|nr:class I SAM-dependent methyltransferase [Ferribacterium limneticum]UCV22643.1 class I SAM-dependent methyltransferase [Ferribacterium limneticum]
MNLVIEAPTPTTSTLHIPTTPPDYAAIKQRQQATWASGDYSVIGTTLQIVAESLAEAADVHAGTDVLDVAAGNGNATLAAARRFAKVTSTDYVPALLDKGRQRALAEGQQVQFEVADAEQLPFDTGSFDVVLSTFGAMFTPDHARCAHEMLRVLRPGGRIGLASWTPQGFIGRLFKTISAHVPPPAGLKSPVLWGTEPHIVELFGSRAAEIRSERRLFNFRYRSAAHWLQVFRDYYGPTHKAFAALDAAGQQELERDIKMLLDELNTAGQASLVVPSEYLEVIITKG